MLYGLEEDGADFIVRERLVEKPASELGVAEKAIESWIAQRPELLFPNEQVLVIAQSVSGESMADVIALDSFGNLLVVEIKRDWSDRSTVAQLLEYAANYKDCRYEILNQLAQRYEQWSGGELIERFRSFSDRPEFSKEDFCNHQRVFIVAPDSDTGLKRIVEWLSGYGVPIEFVPFKLLADDENSLRFIEIDGTASESGISVEDDAWAGHWIFNTNETYAPGAYERMFERGVIAVYGYENDGANLEGSTPGQLVFAYVNGQGVRALGEIEDAKVRSGSGIFLDDNGVQQPAEYHLPVSWHIILPRENAFSNAEASAMGYNLPVRTVFGRLHRGRLASQIEAEVSKRGSEKW